MKIRMLMLSLAGIITLLDQITKAWVSQIKPNLQVIPGFFTIHYVENTGAAFGILQGKQLFLTIVSLVAVVVLIALLFAEREKRYTLMVSLALILGGTCGNLIDRARLHYVVDFLQFYAKLFGRYFYWPSFNIADSAITIGVGLLILFTLRQEHLAKKSSQTS